MSEQRNIVTRFLAQKRRWAAAGLSALTVSGLVLGGLASPSGAAAAELPKNVSFSQWADVAPANWTTGGLGLAGSNASAYTEGDTVPFLLDVTAAGPGDWTFSICRDYLVGGNYGYLSLRPYNTSRSPGGLPLMSSGSGPVSGGATTGSVTIDSVTELNDQGACNHGQRETDVSITVAEAGGLLSNAYVLWGGYLASPADTGVAVGHGAGAFNGATLGMTLESANKTLVIKVATAVIPPVIPPVTPPVDCIVTPAACVPPVIPPVDPPVDCVVTPAACVPPVDPPVDCVVTPAACVPPVIPPVDPGTPPADPGTPPADPGTPPADPGTPPADTPPPGGTTDPTTIIDQLPDPGTTPPAGPTTTTTKPKKVHPTDDDNPGTDDSGNYDPPTTATTIKVVAPAVDPGTQVAGTTDQAGTPAPEQVLGSDVERPAPAAPAMPAPADTLPRTGRGIAGQILAALGFLIAGLGLRFSQRRKPAGGQR